MPSPTCRCLWPASWALGPPGVRAAVGAASTRSLRESCPSPSPGRTRKITAPWSSQARAAALAPWSSFRGPGEYPGCQARPTLWCPYDRNPTGVAPTFPRLTRSRAPGRNPKLLGLVKRGRGPGSMWSHVCMNSALAEQAHHAPALARELGEAVKKLLSSLRCKLPESRSRPGGASTAQGEQAGCSGWGRDWAALRSPN